MYKDETRFEMKCFVWDGMLTAAFHKPDIGIHQRGQRRVDSGCITVPQITGKLPDVPHATIRSQCEKREETLR